MKVYFDEAQSRHSPRFFLQRGQVRPNYEVPGRAEALLEGCRALGLDIIRPDRPTLEALTSVHAPDYLAWLRDAPAAWAALGDAGPEIVPNMHPAPEMLAAGGRPSASPIAMAGWYTADTSCPVSAETWDAALASAGAALAAADEAAQGRDSYALCRPPGHHAYPARAGGHCYINNAALAAERLRASGAERVAILDIDSHHGNGTQGVFYTRPDVLFVSVHGDPAGYYPWFCGHADEGGHGPGSGTTRNFPLAAGTDDLGWLAAIEAGLRAIERFHPDALVVSLGFDASRDEPLRYLSVSEDGFARAGVAIGRLDAPAAFIQEGGYNVDRLGALLGAFFGGFAGT